MSWGATRKEKETEKPREEQAGAVVLGGRGSGTKAAPFPAMLSDTAGDLPRPKHTVEVAASACVMHLEKPAVTEKEGTKTWLSDRGW